MSPASPRAFEGFFADADGTLNGMETIAALRDDPIADVIAQAGSGGVAIVADASHPPFQGAMQMDLPLAAIPPCEEPSCTATMSHLVPHSIGYGEALYANTVGVGLMAEMGPDQPKAPGNESGLQHPSKRKRLNKDYSDTIAEFTGEDREAEGGL